MSVSSTGLMQNAETQAVERRKTDEKPAGSGSAVHDAVVEVLNALPAAVYMVDSRGQITFHNNAAAQFWGRRPAMGQERWCGSLRLFWPDGRHMHHEECAMANAIRQRLALVDEAVAERPDGSRVAFRAFPRLLFAPDGELSGAVNTLIDITDRKEAEFDRKVLLDELNHRVKNTLATVQSIAAQTFRGKAAKDVQSAFEGRLRTLSNAHDTLAASNWHSADLVSIAGGACMPHGVDGRLEIIGVPVRVGPRVALTLAMVFHELAANAVRHGALATALGSATLEWRVTSSNGSRQLVIGWKELHTEPRPPNPPGFGMRLIERGITHELGGRVEIHFTPVGLQCRIEVPLHDVPE